MCPITDCVFDIYLCTFVMHYIFVFVSEINKLEKKRSRPWPTLIQVSRTPRYWKYTRITITPPDHPHICWGIEKTENGIAATTDDVLIHLLHFSL